MVTLNPSGTKHMALQIDQCNRSIQGCAICPMVFFSNCPASLQQRTRCAVLLWTRLTSLWRLKMCIQLGTSQLKKHVTCLLMCRHIRSNYVQKEPLPVPSGCTKCYKWMLGIYRQSVMDRMILGPVLSSSLQGIVRVKEGQVFVRTLECTTAKHNCLW